MPIRPLPALLVNQIAAGEVIERPASVVKELVENAIDAGATRIAIAIENGGRDLVSVIDDGAGIAADELLMAVAPHATSKIAAAGDLEAIATMGFRGEALASIASVSRLSILSRPPDAAEAARIDVEGGDAVGPRPAAGPPGTAVTVRSLFFNTPARRKFLRTDATETQRVAQVVEALAVSHPGIGMSLMVDGRTRLELPAGQPPARRTIAVLGEELEGELLELEHAAGGARLWGMVGRPGVARGTGRHLRLYLNGRPIADRTLIHAVREAYRGLIAPDRHPTAVVMLEMDPAAVDVNVHPAKAEVRFRDPSRIHGLVRQAIAGRLAEADLVPALDVSRAAPAFGSGMPAGGAAPSRRGDEGFAPRWAEPKPAGFSLAEAREAMERPGPAVPAPILEAQVAPEVLQVLDCYLVTEDEEGLLIIDQHALHERVMFEKISQRLEEGELESQRLLMPATIEADAEQLEHLADLQPLLRQLGIEAGPIGPRAIGIHAFTSLLLERGVEPAAFLADLLRRTARRPDQATPEAALHEVVDMMACKAAIKAGDRLSPREMSELLAWRHAVGRSSRCPHGRPTTMRLTRAELDRQFGR